MMRSSVLLALLCAAAVHAQTPPAEPPPAAAQARAGASASASVVPGSDQPGPVSERLIVTDIKVGYGREAKVGATVSVNYSGWLYRPLALHMHGKLFDSSLGLWPFEFTLGAGKVIKGWEQGIAGMKVGGGKRTLIIPAELAYGSRGAPGGIPPNSALIYDVELMDVK